MNWGKKLREIRRFRGITQTDLASRTYITRQTINRIETDRNVPLIDKYDALLRSMGFCLEIVPLDDNKDWRLP